MTQTHGTDTSFYLIVPQDDAQLGNKIISTEAHSSTFSFEMKIPLRTNLFVLERVEEKKTIKNSNKISALWLEKKKNNNRLE